MKNDFPREMWTSVFWKHLVKFSNEVGMWPWGCGPAWHREMPAETFTAVQFMVIVMIQMTT